MGLLKKSEEERRNETKANIRRYRSQIDRFVRDFTNSRQNAINNAKKALAENNLQAAKNAARNILRHERFIKYLKSFSLFIDNLQTTMDYVYMERNAQQTLLQANKNLSVNMLSEEQANQIQQSIENIMDNTRDLEERANSQLESLDTSLSSFSNQKAEDVGKILEGIVSGGNASGTTGTDSDKALEELLSKIAKEGEKT
ncbi:MAG: Snf7 family protein [Thermoplasmataceae archaeon]